MIHPTVGRKVWYRPSVTDLAAPQAVHLIVMDGQPLDATIVAVHNTRCVNLVIFDAVGVQHRRMSVTLVQEGDTPPIGAAYAEWMPYQNAQAKKEGAA